MMDPTRRSVGNRAPESNSLQIGRRRGTEHLLTEIRAILPLTAAGYEQRGRGRSGVALCHDRSFPVAEAPHLYRRGDACYRMLAEGGTERGHVVLDDILVG